MEQWRELLAWPNSETVDLEVWDALLPERGGLLREIIHIRHGRYTARVLGRQASETILVEPPVQRADVHAQISSSAEEQCYHSTRLVRAKLNHIPELGQVDSNGPPPRRDVAEDNARLRRGSIGRVDQEYLSQQLDW